VLQCVAVCCSVLQLFWFILLLLAMLQCAAVCCSVLQCVAALLIYLTTLGYVAVCCSVLQCVAVCCSSFDLSDYSWLCVRTHHVCNMIFEWKHLCNMIWSENTCATWFFSENSYTQCSGPANSTILIDSNINIYCYQYGNIHNMEIYWYINGLD